MLHSRPWLWSREIPRHFDEDVVYKLNLDGEPALEGLVNIDSAEASTLEQFLRGCGSMLGTLGDLAIRKSFPRVHRLIHLSCKRTLFVGTASVDLLLRAQILCPPLHISIHCKLRRDTM